MSSNLRIKKICQFCHGEFIAKTTKTKFCCLRCAQKNYKVQQKQKKLVEAEASYNSAKQRVKSKKDNEPFQLGSEEVITVKEASRILHVSHKTIYNMIYIGRLEAINLNHRLTRVKKSSIDELIDFDLKKAEKNNIFDIDDAYTINEVTDELKLAPSFVYKKLLEYGVPKIKSGKNVLVPRKLVDLIFKNHIR